MHAVRMCFFPHLRLHLFFSFLVLCNFRHFLSLLLLLFITDYGMFFCCCFMHLKCEFLCCRCNLEHLLLRLPITKKHQIRLNLARRKWSASFIIFGSFSSLFCWCKENYDLTIIMYKHTKHILRCSLPKNHRKKKPISMD